MTDLEWYTAHNCTHAHCPGDCEHPQPFILDDKLVCGRCYFKYDEVVEMIPCTPQVCDTDYPHIRNL